MVALFSEGDLRAAEEVRAPSSGRVSVPRSSSARSAARSLMVRISLGVPGAAEVARESAGRGAG
jgi:hypothetical protein